MNKCERDEKLVFWQRALADWVEEPFDAQFPIDRYSESACQGAVNWILEIAGMQERFR